MGIFLGILLIGFIYVWKKGALEWIDRTPMAESSTHLQYIQEKLGRRVLDTLVFRGDDILILDRAGLRESYGDARPARFPQRHHRRGLLEKARAALRGGLSGGFLKGGEGFGCEFRCRKTMPRWSR